MHCGNILSTIAGLFLSVASFWVWSYIITLAVINKKLYFITTCTYMIFANIFSLLFSKKMHLMP